MRFPAAFLWTAPDNWRCGRAVPGRRDRNVDCVNGDGFSNSMINSSTVTSAPATYRKSHSIPSPTRRIASSGLAARKIRPPPASTSTRTGTVRTANSVSSWLATSRSDDAGGAATSDGASARGGAGMNEDGRGFSPWVNHVATAAPLDEMRVRGRRDRFFSGTGGRAFGTTFAATGGGFRSTFGFATTRAAGLG